MPNRDSDAAPELAQVLLDWMPFFSSARTSLALRARTARFRWFYKHFPPFSFSFPFSLFFWRRRQFFALSRYWFQCKTHPVGIIKYELFVLPAPFSAKIELFSAAGNFFGYLKSWLHSRKPLVGITKFYVCIFFNPLPEIFIFQTKLRQMHFHEIDFFVLRTKIFFRHPVGYFRHPAAPALLCAGWPSDLWFWIELYVLIHN